MGGPPQDQFVTSKKCLFNIKLIQIDSYKNNIGGGGVGRALQWREKIKGDIGTKLGGFATNKKTQNGHVG